MPHGRGSHCGVGRLAGPSVHACSVGAAPEDQLGEAVWGRWVSVPVNGALSKQVEQREYLEGWKVLGDVLDIISEAEATLKRFF